MFIPADIGKRAAITGSADFNFRPYAAVMQERIKTAFSAKISRPTDVCLARRSATWFYTPKFIQGRLSHGDHY